MQCSQLRQCITWINVFYWLQQQLSFSSFFLSIDLTGRLSLSHGHSVITFANDVIVALLVTDWNCCPYWSSFSCIAPGRQLWLCSTSWMIGSSCCSKSIIISIIVCTSCFLLFSWFHLYSPSHTLDRLKQIRIRRIFALSRCCTTQIRLWFVKEMLQIQYYHYFLIVGTTVQWHYCSYGNAAALRATQCSLPLQLVFFFIYSVRVGICKTVYYR